MNNSKLIGQVRFNYRGEWNSSATYKMLDYVQHKDTNQNNHIYVATDDIGQGIAPGSEGNNAWIDISIQAPSVNYMDSKVETVASSAWNQLSNKDPFTYVSRTITLTGFNSEPSMVQLINNNAVLFANYCFSIGSCEYDSEHKNISITVYSIGKPFESVDLTFVYSGTTLVTPSQASNQSQQDNIEQSNQNNEEETSLDNNEETLPEE